MVCSPQASAMRLSHAIRLPYLRRVEYFVTYVLGPYESMVRNRPEICFDLITCACSRLPMRQQMWQGAAKEQA